MSFVWGEERLSPPDKVAKRCLACGRHFTPSAVDAARCGVCLLENRPVDLVMRWIWGEDNHDS